MRDLYESVAGEVEKVVVGQESMTATALAAISLGGHVLLEGPPGVAKTLLAAALSRALGARLPPRAVHARHAPVRRHRQRRRCAAAS